MFGRCSVSVPKKQPCKSLRKTTHLHRPVGKWRKIVQLDRGCWPNRRRRIDIVPRRQRNLQPRLYAACSSTNPSSHPSQSDNPDDHLRIAFQVTTDMMPSCKSMLYFALQIVLHFCLNERHKVNTMRLLATRLVTSRATKFLTQKLKILIL